MRLLKKSLFLIFLILTISTLLTVAMAIENNNEVGNSNNSNTIDNTILFSIKSKYLGNDRDWNTVNVRINISVDRLGHLVYLENYYSQGSEELKLYTSNRYYDANITDKVVSFNISRPKSKNRLGMNYLFIESIIIFDNTIIFDQMLNSSTKNISYTNMQPIKLNNFRNLTPSISDTDELSKTDNLNEINSDINEIIYKANDMGNQSTENASTMEKPKINNIGFTMAGIITVIVMFSMVYTFKRRGRTGK